MNVMDNDNVFTATKLIAVVVLAIWAFSLAMGWV